MRSAYDPSRGASRRVLGALGILTAGTVGLLVWAAIAEIDISAMGTGQVIPNRRVQVVQNLEGGILQELFVKEGQAVKIGQPVARFQDTEFSASLAEADANQSGQAAQTARLTAEIAATEAARKGDRLPANPNFSEVLRAANPELVARELQLFNAHMANLRAVLDGTEAVIRRARSGRIKAMANLPLLRNQLSLTVQQRGIVGPQVANGLVSKLELIAIEQRMLEIRTRINEAERDINTAATEASEAEERRNGELQKFRGDALAQLTENNVKSQALKAQVSNLKDRVKRRQLVAPVNGIVKRILLSTVGAVLRPGADVMEIVPSDDERIVEARFAPQDIAFIQKEQKAYIRITAYDASIYGSMPAVVSQVSADATTTEREEVYYRVQVRAKGILRDSAGKELPIVPGMVAQVDVLTGKRKLLDYWLKPITRVRYTALHER